jgi:hypothetical protein
MNSQLHPEYKILTCLCFKSQTRCGVVLLADHDVVVRNLVRQFLEQAGFGVLSAADVDLPVPDDMPRLDGISLAEKLKSERPAILSCCNPHQAYENWSRPPERVQRCESAVYRFIPDRAVLVLGGRPGLDATIWCF